MTNQQAIILLSQMFLIQFTEEEWEALSMAIDALNNVREKGQWIDEPTHGGFKVCSNCGCQKRQGSIHFCASCGADMREK